MENRVKCVSLRTIKYNDSSSIVTLWSDEMGRFSAIVPAGASREARRRRAIMMPLGTFEAVATLRAGRDLATLTDVRLLQQSPAATGDPRRTALAMFISEFLYAVLKESSPDRLLSQFLFDSIAALNNLPSRSIANFHLYFLYALSHFMGIQPDMGTFQSGFGFSYADGRFAPIPPLRGQWLDSEKAKVIRLLSRLSLRNLHIVKLNHIQRNELLDGILEYYTLHCAPVNSLSSLAFLREK